MQKSGPGIWFYISATAPIIVKRMSWKQPSRTSAAREFQAGENSGEVYDDIKSSLSLPQVPLFFQQCASHANFLSQFWEAVRPAVRTSVFETAARRLRANAYTCVYSYFEIEAADSTAAPVGLTAAVDLFYIQGGMLLLLLALGTEALDNPVGQPLATREEPPPPPAGLPPILVDDETAAPETRKIFDEARRQYGLGVVPAEFRALAAWPAFLNQHWRLWKQVAQSPLMASCEHQLMSHSIELTQSLPGPVELTLSSMRQGAMKDREFAGFVRFVNNWNRASALLLLQISAAKISLEGGNGHVRSRTENRQEQAA